MIAVVVQLIVMGGRAYGRHSGVRFSTRLHAHILQRDNDGSITVRENDLHASTCRARINLMRGVYKSY